ncbi:MAG: DHHA1 domain-containing protein [Candidatus Aenigmatarchaeota archaeon]
MKIPGELEELLEESREKFQEMEKVRIVSHYDADGISSAAIALAAALREGKKVHHTVVKQLRPETMERFEHEENLLFTDLGSGHLSLINELDSENMIVLDHHHLSGELENGVHVNPHLAGMEEDTVSGAGVTYLFARTLDEDNVDLSSLAVVGAIGDIQEENWRMKGLNEKIMEEAVEVGVLEKGEGLRLFGRLSRPVHKALEYTTNPYIPEVSESESGAVQFLSSLDIDLKNGDGSWKKLVDLSEDEKKELASAIVKKRARNGVDDAGEIFGSTYTLPRFDGRFRDARELSTALNACGRMERADVGILACLGSARAKEKLEQVVQGYRKTLGKLISMVRGNEDMLEERSGFNLLDGTEEIPENFVGTICSILQSDLSPDKMLVGLAESENERLKVSIRAPDDSEIKVNEVIEGVSEEMDIEGGGHEKAGGAYIHMEHRGEFLEALERELSGSP